MKNLINLLENEKSKFQEIDERISNEYKLLKEAREKKEQAILDVNTIEELQAETHIQAHQKALQTLTEKRQKLFATRPEILPQAMELIAEDLILSDKDKHAKRTSLAKKLPEIVEALFEIQKDQADLVQEARNVMAPYQGYIDPKILDDLQRSVASHDRADFQALQQYTASIQALTNSFDKLTKFTNVKEYNLERQKATARRDELRMLLRGTGLAPDTRRELNGELQDIMREYSI